MHSTGVGEKAAYNFTSAHRKKHNKLSTSTRARAHTHTEATHTRNQPHTESKDHWEGELQPMKDVCLESGLKRINRVCLPDGPGQDIPLGMGDIPEGSQICGEISNSNCKPKEYRPHEIA